MANAAGASSTEIRTASSSLLPQPAAQQPASTPAGSFEYASPVDENLCCPICQGPFQDPWMSKTCEHFYCYDCIVQHIGSCTTAPATCPCDRLPLSLEQDSESKKPRQLVPAPRLVKLLCDELLVKCSSRPDCAWSGQRAHWQRHRVNECSTRDKTCSNGCGYTGLDLQMHEQKHCPRKPEVCNVCNGLVPLDDLDAHKTDCPAQKIECPDCGAKDIVKSRLAVHTDQSCPEYIIACPHAGLGCAWSGPRRQLQGAHLSSECLFEPLKTVLYGHRDKIEALEAENSSLKEELSSLRGTYEDLHRRVERLSQSVGARHANNDNTLPLTEQMGALTSQMAELSRNGLRNQHTHEQALHNVKEELSSVQMTMHELRGEIMALQHQHYYENASRYWARSGSAAQAAAMHDTKGGPKDGSSSSSDKSQANADSTGLASAGIPPHIPGMPVPGYAMHPAYAMGYGHGQPAPPMMLPYAMPPGVFGPRRWPAWPQAYTGASTSPEERGGGFKL